MLTCEQNGCGPRIKLCGLSFDMLMCLSLRYYFSQLAIRKWMQRTTEKAKRSKLCCNPPIRRISRVFVLGSGMEYSCLSSSMLFLEKDSRLHANTRSLGPV
jgi:hypothetical protein